MSIAAALEAILGFLELGGELVPHWIDRPFRTPRRGSYLCNRHRIRLHGQDLRPEGSADGFSVDLPPRTILRVDTFRRFGAESIWVRPQGVDVLSELPARMQQAARAYGYALEIPRGIFKAQFEALPPAT